MTTTQPKRAERRTFTAAECDAMVAAGLIAAGEREAAADGQRRYTVAEYFALVEIGVLGERDRIELLAGEIIVMSPIGDPHADCTDLMAGDLIVALRGRARVRVQGPIQLDDRSRPEPDLAVLRLRPGYDTSPATPDDVYLVIEVSDSSLRYDRGEKLARYAEAGIPEVWIVNLQGRELEVYTEPSGAGYVGVRRIPADGSVSPQAFPDVMLHLRDFMPGQADC